MRDTTTTITYGALALRPGGSGVQTYSRSLLNAMSELLPEAALNAIVQSDAVSELPARVRPLRRPVSAGIRRALAGARPVGTSDVFHALDVDLPIRVGGPTVATVHDLSVFDVPGAYTGLRARGEQFLLRHAIRRADALIAVSNFTAERIADLFGRSATVTPLAPADWVRRPSQDEVEEVRRSFDLPERFVLQVGSVEPRKQVGLVAEASRQIGLPCVLAGAGSQGPNAPAKTIGLGYVTTEMLPALYAAATITAYASSYEGFGLPPVEAMACGGAVVASAVGALPDVVADGAVLVDALDVAAWVKALGSVADDADRRTELTRRAVAVANTMSWNTTASQTVSVYRELGARI